MWFQNETRKVQLDALSVCCLYTNY